jgi:hypothetical protein
MIRVPRQNHDHRDNGGFCSCCGMVWPCARVRRATDRQREPERLPLLPRQLTNR